MTELSFIIGWYEPYSGLWGKGLSDLFINELKKLEIIND